VITLEPVNLIYFYDINYNVITENCTHWLIDVCGIPLRSAIQKFSAQKTRTQPRTKEVLHWLLSRSLERYYKNEVTVMKTTFFRNVNTAQIKNITNYDV